MAREMTPQATRSEIDIILHENKQLREQNRVLRCALESIAKNTCCAPCREAALVAQAALTATSQPTKPQGRMHACDIPGCVSCGNPEDATSQEGQHG